MYKIGYSFLMKRKSGLYKGFGVNRRKKITQHKHYSQV
jgi:hypothetical protein